MRHLLLALVFTGSSPAEAVAQAPTPAAEPAVDAARLALAGTTVEHLWPLGTYARMMGSSMDRMMDSMMASMFDLKMGDVGAAAGASDKKDPGLRNMTMREAMAKADPHFQERMKITNRVMMNEMIPVMSRIEPDLRSALARVYARKFTSEQLADLNRFFATPSGRLYAAESMMLYVEPEVMGLMGKFAPEFMKAMPDIMAKVQAATAHLPPPPKARDEEESARPTS
jgi:hypothetical protein